MTNAERRGFPRFEIMAQIRLKRGRVNYVMDVKDLSLSGLAAVSEALGTATDFKVGQEVELDVFVLEELDNTRLHGTLVRVEKHPRSGTLTLAVHFGQLDGPSTRALESLVARAKAGSIHPPPLPGPKR